MTRDQQELLKKSAPAKQVVAAMADYAKRFGGFVVEVCPPPTAGRSDNVIVRMTSPVRTRRSSTKPSSPPRR